MSDVTNHGGGRVEGECGKFPTVETAELRTDASFTWGTICQTASSPPASLATVR